MSAAEAADWYRPSDAERAALARACGHAIGDPDLIERLGYRFYAMPGADLPSFLNKRFPVGAARTAALTLVAGIDAESRDDALEACHSSADAALELRRLPATLWLVRVAVGNTTITWRDLAGAFADADPAAFAAVAAELRGLKLCVASSCPLCGPDGA